MYINHPKGSHPETKSASVWNFSKVGGRGLPKSQLFKELFCSVHALTFFRKGGGLPYSKLFEELLCLSLDIFQEGRGGGVN